MENFRKLGISEPILKSIEEQHFEEPSEIQEKSIPLVVSGKDVIAGASTGSGKTLAFGTGIIQKSKKDFGIQALILTPTRELAEQVSSALRKFSKHSPLKIVAIYGGMSMNRQMEDLERAEVVVATPGRMLDHLERGNLKLNLIKILVLDEADRMLDMGFVKDVDKIISQCPKERQTLLFSATISQDIEHLAKKYLKNPVRVSAEPNVDPKKLKQTYYDTPDSLKFSLLSHLLSNEKSDLVMVFCNTRRNADFVAKNLKHAGIESHAIHGGFTQDKRNKILELFHTKKVHVLVCTDVAARGLDIKGVSHVYNYDTPNDPKEYVHRIGRTARAGKEGNVINIIASRDYENFSNLLNKSDFTIEKKEMPEIERVQLILDSPRSRFGGRGDRGRPNGRFSRNNSGRRYSEKSRNNSNRDRNPSRRRDNYKERDNYRENNYRSDRRSEEENNRNNPRRNTFKNRYR